MEYAQLQLICIGLEALGECQGWTPGAQLRRRMGQMRRLHRARVAATPTPPVTATITQW